MSTFINFDEIILAEKFTEIHPWVSMINLQELAVRQIVLLELQAASNRDKIAFLGTMDGMIGFYRQILEINQP